jgi:hypothetical protein
MNSAHTASALAPHAYDYTQHLRPVTAIGYQVTTSDADGKIAMEMRSVCRRSYIIITLGHFYSFHYN